MGLIPGWGGATRLKNIVGRNRALEILLSCRTIECTEALNIGLCDKIIGESQHPLNTTIKWLDKLSDHDFSVLSAIKRSVTEIDKNALENERKLFAPLWSGPANREALSKNMKH